MEHEHFEEMAVLYAAGALEVLECREFEEHLQTGCMVCPNLVKDYRETLSLLPHGLPTASVPAHLKSQLMERISTEASQTPVEVKKERGAGTMANRWRYLRVPVFRPAFILLIIFVLAGTGYYALSLRLQLEGEIEQRQQVVEVLEEANSQIALLRQKVTEQSRVVGSLRGEQNTEIERVSALEEELATRMAEVDRMQTRLVEREEETTFLRRVLAQKDDVVRLLLSPDVVVVSLDGLEQSPGSAFLLFDPERKRGLFYSFGLPALPRGKVYQLWAIVDNPVSVGTFDLDKGRKGRLLIKNLTNFSRISKFAVSLEPEGGRTKPTGTIHLMGDV